MKKGWWILITVVFILTCWVVSYRMYYQAQFNRRVQVLSEDGVPVSFSDLDRMDALPLGVPNAAYIYTQAFSRYQKPDKSLKSFLPRQGSYEMAENEPPFPDEVMEAIATSLEANMQTLALLDEGATIENCVYPRPRPLDMDKQDLFISIKNCGWLLSDRILYLGQIHKTEKLLIAMQTLLKFSESPIRQGVLIDEMIALGLKNMATVNLEWVLNEMEFTDSQLIYLQQGFSDIQDLKACYRGLIKERIYYLEHILSPFDKRPEKPSTLNRWGERIYSVLGLMQKENMMHLDYFERCIEAAQLPLEERSYEFYEISCDLGINTPPWQLYLSSIAANIKIAEIDMRVIGCLRCAETALAIERYRLKYRSLPESLEQLVPEFMAEVPREPFDNEVLRYIKHDVGYTVYTIGEDGVDNGGLSKEQMKEKTGEDNPKEYDWLFTVRR